MKKKMYAIVNSSDYLVAANGICFNKAWQMSYYWYQTIDSLDAYITFRKESGWTEEVIEYTYPIVEVCGECGKEKDD